MCIFFDGVKDGLKWLWLSSPEYYEVDVMVSTAKHEHMDSAPAMLCDLFARMEAGKFIGNAEIEFVRQFDRTAAERFAKYRLDYCARREEQERQERLKREAVEEAEKSRKEAELEAEKAKYYGWADTMTPMRFGKVRAKMEGVVRADGKVMSLRDFVTGLVKDGWEPAKRDGVTRWYGSKWEPKQSKPRTEYVLARDGCSYKVSKTEYDFAVYLTKCKEILGQ